MSRLYDRVWQATATTGTGTMTLGAAQSGYLTAAEASVQNGDIVSYVIIDGANFEVGTGTYTVAGTTLSRDTVSVSKIGGTAGTTKLTLSGSATVFLTMIASDVLGQQTIWLPAAAMTARVTNGMQAGSLETTTNRINSRYWAADPAALEYVQAQVQMPKGWNRGTLILQFIWFHPATTVNFGVVWGARAMALGDAEAMDTAPGTAVTVTDAGGTTNANYISPETAAMTVGSTPGSEELVVFEFYRDAANGSDTMAVDAFLVGVKIHYTTNLATDD